MTVLKLLKRARRSWNFMKVQGFFCSNSASSSRTTRTLEIRSWDSKVWGLERVSSQMGLKAGFSHSSIICVLLAPFQGVDCDCSLKKICISLWVSLPAVSKEGTNTFHGSQLPALRRLWLLLGDMGQPERLWRDQADWGHTPYLQKGH